MANFGDFQVQILIQKTSRKEFILPTINQLVRKERKKVIKKSKSPALVSALKEEEYAQRVYTQKFPKKPKTSGTLGKRLGKKV